MIHNGDAALPPPELECHRTFCPPRSMAGRPAEMCQRSCTSSPGQEDSARDVVSRRSGSVTRPTPAAGERTASGRQQTRQGGRRVRRRHRPRRPLTQDQPVNCGEVGIKPPFPYGGASTTTWEETATPPASCDQAGIIQQILSRTFITIGPGKTEATYNGWQCYGDPGNSFVPDPTVVVCRKGQFQIGAEYLRM
jgi:hypothetical protein